MQNLVEYGWELAWRPQMVTKKNLEQMHDLPKRILCSGRPEHFIDYWRKRPESKQVDREAIGVLREVPKSDFRKKRGRPSMGTVRPKAPSSSAGGVPPTGGTPGCGAA